MASRPPSEPDSFQALAESIPHIVFTADSSGTITYFNQNASRYTGNFEDWVSFTHPDDLKSICDAWTRAVASHTPLEHESRLRRLDGAYRWHVIRATPMTNAQHTVQWFGTCTDVDDLKRAQEEIRLSAANFASVLETAPEVIMSLDRETKIRFINRVHPPFRIEDVVGTYAFDSVSDATRNVAQHAVDETFRTGENHNYECEGPPLEDGLRRWYFTLAGPVKRDGEVVAVTLCTTDITLRKRAEDALNVSLQEQMRAQELLRSVLESVSDAIVTVNEQCEIRGANPAATHLYGYREDELVGQSVDTFITLVEGQHAVDGHELFERGALRGRPQEVEARRKDGSTFVAELTVTTFLLSGKKHFTGVVRDITDRKRLEAEFRQAHKMEAFGQLAGGVAHDFNNLLTVILGETQMLLAGLSLDDATTTALKDIQDAGERAAALTRQLLAFSRKTVLEPKKIDLNVSISEMEKMLRRLIGEDIALSTDLAPVVDWITVDPSQLTQILINLAVNARDAMPRGGQLCLGTELVEVLPDRPHPTVPLAAGRYVKVTVADTGEGMIPEVRANAFQPFFTTKGVGKGTGLGLAVVHGIVVQSGAHINLVSDVGKGTVFEIFFPSSRSRSAAYERKASIVPAFKSARVLVVEDDELVRRLAVRVLIAKGYQVVTAHDGAHALDVLSNKASDVDVLLTDVVMPNLDGRELAERVAALYPNVKVLYTSGYTEDVLMRRGILHDTLNFLPKPYTPAQLSAAVRRLVDREAAPNAAV